MVAPAIGAAHTIASSVADVVVSAHGARDEPVGARVVPANLQDFGHTPATADTCDVHANADREGNRFANTAV